MQTIANLHSNLNITTAAFFDFPHSVPESLPRKVLRAVKDMHEKGKPDRFPRMALVEAYFGASPTLNIMSSEWDVAAADVRVPGYSASDFMSLLEARYQPKKLRRRAAMSEILDIRFVRTAIQDGGTLTEVGKRLRTLIHRACDCSYEELDTKLAPRPHGNTNNHD